MVLMAVAAALAPGIARLAADDLAHVMVIEMSALIIARARQRSPFTKARLSFICSPNDGTAGQ